jgi:hypothetical protein
MKKRHEQKLVLLSLVLLLLFNIPALLIYEGSASFWGIPKFYFVIFSIWGLSSLISYIILKRHYE